MKAWVVRQIREWYEFIGKIVALIVVSAFIGFGLWLGIYAAMDWTGVNISVTLTTGEPGKR